MTCYLGHYIMTCHLGHYEDLPSWTLYMTCHLGHYLGLVILDIIYDLSSWTLYMTCHLGHMTYNLCKLSDICKTIKDPSLIHKNICLLATHRTSLMCNNTFFLIT